MIHALDHVAVATRDLRVAARRTSALLGRSPWWQGSIPSEGAETVRFRLANTTLVLRAPAEREGVAGLAFASEDVDACAERLRAAGVAVGEPCRVLAHDAGSGGWLRWRQLALPPGSTRGLPVVLVQRLDPDPEAEPAGAAGVSAIDHVVVTCPDLDASRAVYAGRLGLRLALDRSFPDRGLRMLFFRSGGLTVELVGSLGASARPDSADGFGGLAYRVEDVEAARLRLQGAGFDLSELRPGAKPGTRVCTVRDAPCQVPTLLIQPAP